jgi:signal transduction histidine kinase
VETWRGFHLSQLLALIVGSVALVALVGYVYGVTSLYGISPQTGMALHTAATFLLLSGGVLLIKPEQGLMRLLTSEGMGGIAARRLLTAAIIIPVLLGWFLMLGQRAGLYDAALSSSLLVVGSILSFSSLIWFSAKALERLDARRREAEEARAQLLRRVVAAQEEERRRIARELHDQTGQHLVALSLQLELHREALRQSHGTEDHLPQVLELADRLTREVHSLAWELRPPELDHLGLQAALSRYVEQWSARSGIAADFISTGFGDSRLTPDAEVTLYRVTQEALTNVLKHSRARNVSLVLERLPNEVLAVIEDDGCGFDVEIHTATSPADARLGILGMRERIEFAGGSLTIESSPGAGTTLAVRVPLRAVDDEESR